jgi:hypothetical protein
MPTLMPALAITTSGRPCAARQARPAPTMLSICHVGGVDAQRVAQALRLCPVRSDAFAPRHQRQPPAGAA